MSTELVALTAIINAHFLDDDDVCVCGFADFSVGGYAAEDGGQQWQNIFVTHVAEKILEAGYSREDGTPDTTELDAITALVHEDHTRFWHIDDSVDGFTTVDHFEAERDDEEDGTYDLITAIVVEGPTEFYLFYYREDLKGRSVTYLTDWKIHIVSRATKLDEDSKELWVPADLNAEPLREWAGY
jgi:hypothetical protein